MSSYQINYGSPSGSPSRTPGDHEDEGRDVHTPRRVPMACTFCRRRKIKCDGRKNSCWNCEKRGVVCTYVSVANEQQEQKLGSPFR